MSRPNQPQKVEPFSIGVRPHNFDAERGVLGALLLDNSQVSPVMKIVKASDFYDPRHQFIFDAMHSVHNDGRPIELTLVLDQLRLTPAPGGGNALEAAGGPLTVAGLEQFIMATSSAPYHAEVVKQNSVTRKIMDVAENILSRAPHEPLDEIIGYIRPEFERIIQQAASGSRIPSGYQVRTMEDCEIDEPAAPWVIKNLIEEESLTMCFGKPTSKKTMTLMHACVSIACGHEWLTMEPIEKRPVVWVNLDMGERTFKQRTKALRRGIEATPGLFFSYHHVRPRLNPLIPSHMAILENLIRLHGAKLLVVDSLQKTFPSGTDENDQRVAEVINAFSALVQDTKCAIILIHHAGKSGDTYRGSSALEDNIDISFKFESEKGSRDVTITQVKQRNNELEPIHLTFKFDHMEDRRTLDWATFEKNENPPGQPCQTERLIWQYVRDHHGCSQNNCERAMKELGIKQTKYRDTMKAMLSTSKMYLARVEGGLVTTPIGDNAFDPLPEPGPKKVHDPQDWMHDP